MIPESLGHPSDRIVVTCGAVGRYIRSLTQTLNRAIAISLKRNPFESRFVRAVILVKGVHFYGFHCSYSPFLKVIMADPGMVHRAATVLRSGAVMRQKIQPFETHLSFLLQFMCDFGLYGCDWLEFARYYVREGGAETNTKSTYSGPASNPNLTVLPGALPGQFTKSPHTKVSRMSLEIDIVSHQILNRNKLSQRHMHNTLAIPAPAPSPDPLVQSVRELWDIERARRSAIGLNPTPELPVDGNASQRGSGGQWEQEPLFWEQFRSRMTQEKAEVNSAQGWEKWVMTAFESIEALWEEDWKTWVPQLSGTASKESNKIATQAARDSNPFGLTQVDQDGGVLESHAAGGKEDPKLSEVDEDLAAGRAFQKLVTAAEEAEWHENDEQWDELLYDDELRDLATQETGGEVSAPATPT
jgi:DNA polymerase zeta